MDWAWHRERYHDAVSAVETAKHLDEGWGDLEKHPVVVAALAQIDMAERAIKSVADQLNCEYHDD